MKKWISRIKKKNGFTLAELLIVVAIIAVLVAVSIPIFRNQIKKARYAVNQSNIRSAMSVAAAALYDRQYDFSTVAGGYQNTRAVYFMVDTSTGKIEKSVVGNWNLGDSTCVDTVYAQEAKDSLENGIYRKVAVKIPYALILGTAAEGGLAEHQIAVCPHFSDYDGGTLWTNAGAGGPEPGFWPNI